MGVRDAPLDNLGGLLEVELREVKESEHSKDLYELMKELKIVELSCSKQT